MDSTPKTMLTPHQQITAHNYSYPDLGPKPCAHFWKELTLHPPHTPSILIPDTLILNLKEQPVLWVYTNKVGRSLPETSPQQKLAQQSRQRYQISQLPLPKQPNPPTIRRPYHHTPKIHQIARQTRLHLSDCLHEPNPSALLSHHKSQ
jgi:hypothetical protein